MDLESRIAEFEANESEEWDLSREKITRGQYAILGEKVKASSRIRRLDVSGASLWSDAAKVIAEALPSTPNLTELYLSGNSIRAEGARALADALKENGTLCKLDLDDNGVGNSGAAAFADALKVNTGLKFLYLSALKSRGPSAKGTLQQQYVVDDGERMIGFEGAKALAEALRVNRTLHDLTLGGNRITDEGAVCLRDSLKTNHVIQGLDLDACEVSDDLVDEIEVILDANNARRTNELRATSLPSFTSPPPSKSSAVPSSTPHCLHPAKKCLKASARVQQVVNVSDG